MTILGIDLGTTNSLISVFLPEGPKLIPNVHKDVLTPSVVGEADDGTMLVGRAAKDRLITQPSKTVASFKQFMGTAHETRLGKKSFRAEELSAFVLRSLKADAEAFLNDIVTDVVISVPAYFNDHQRKATIDAGKLAGLNVKRLVNEPTAAALAYGFGEKAEGKYLVFDLGGGTFDVSILDCFEGVMEVRATTGDTHLGGNDFTTAIESEIFKRHQLAGKKLSPIELANVLRAAENVKYGLTSQQEAKYTLQVHASTFEGAISRVEFETQSEALLRRLRQPLERAIADARLSPQDLDAILLVGGATRMPAVRSMVARLFGRLPFMSLDPDTTIALGAAVQAGLVARNSALDDVVMTDVCPHSLGVAALDSQSGSDLITVPIISRNAMVPISRSTQLQTVFDKQTQIEVKAYQGENLRPADNVYLGMLHVTVPPKPAGEEVIDIRFTYDVSGAIEVEVKVLSTKLVRRAVFKNDSGLTEEELRRRFMTLETIKLHPREQSENRALISRAERLFAENLGEAREHIKNGLGQFMQIISTDQSGDLDPARKEFSAFLNNFERFRFDS